jgi:peroxiredoxin
MVQIGDKVENFKAEAFYDDEIVDIELQDYLGKWIVLAFYPADFTFVCPTELEDFAERYDDFKAEDGEILSVSTDTAFVHKAWHDHSDAISKVGYPMIADPAGEISKQFGTYKEDEGLSWRATFIINPDGEVAHLEIHNNSIGRNVSEILRRLQAAKYTREHEGQVCPVNWQPGDDTLEEGLDLVGEI